MASVSVLPQSCDCLPGRSKNFGYYDEIPVDVAQSHSTEEIITPTAGLNNKVFEFTIDPKEDSFLNLQSIYLTCKLRVTTADGGNIKSSYTAAETQIVNDGKKDDATAEQKQAYANLRKIDLVAPASNFLHNLWQSVTVKINDTEINPKSSLNYRFKAFLETILTYSKDNSRLTAQGFYPGDSFDYSLNRTKAAEITHLNQIKGNDSQFKRLMLIIESKEVELTGQLHHDVFNCDNYLAPNNKLNIILTRTDDSIPLQYPSGSEYKVKIEELSLSVKRVHLKDAAFSKIMRPLAIQRYLTPYTEVKTYEVAANTTRWVHPIYINEKLPQHMIITMMDTTKFLGNDGGGFLWVFTNALCSKLAVIKNGVRIPKTSLTPSFKEGQVRDVGLLEERIEEAKEHLTSREFYRLFKETGQRKGMVDMKAFRAGYTIYPFDLTPDRCNMRHRHVGEIGNIDVEFEWSQPIPVNKTIIILSTSDQMITIDPKTKHVRTDRFPLLK